MLVDAAYAPVPRGECVFCRLFSLQLANSAKNTLAFDQAAITQQVYRHLHRRIAAINYNFDQKFATH